MANLAQLTQQFFDALKANDPAQYKNILRADVGMQIAWAR